MRDRSRSYSTAEALAFVCLAVIWHAGLSSVWAQAVDEKVPEDAPPPVLTYHGLVPGLTPASEVVAILGEPAFQARWYNHKMLYPAQGRPDMVDVVHLAGSPEGGHVSNIAAATIPQGYQTEEAIRAKLGVPEYELRMATWKLLDYSDQGLRFSLTAEGNTTGVVYVPHTYPRVPSGERKLMDLSHLRQGPQPRPATPAAPKNLKLGVAEVNISPQAQDWLKHPFTIHDDLKARIVVFTDGTLTVALVGADLFGMNYPDILVIREALREKGVDHTIVAMSHDHSAYDTIGVYGHYPSEYIAYIQKQIVQGVLDAYGQVRPVKEIRTASRELPMDGARVMGLIRNARNPGIVDPQVSLLQAVGADGQPAATIVHLTCHPETVAAGSREITADFPGYLCDRIRADGGGQPVFLNGALGGMVSGDNPERTHDSCREMGLRFAAIVRDLAKTAQPPTTFRFHAERRDIEVPNTNPAFKALFETGRREVYRGRFKTDMTYIELGEAQLVSLPGELLPEVSFEILEQMDGFPRMLIGLGNDELGYLVPPYDFREGVYEESMSPGPAASLVVRDAAIRMVKGIR